MTIKDLRKKQGLTQVEAAKITGIPLRTFKLYENDESKFGNIKYQYIVESLQKNGLIDETHGILTVDEITLLCGKIFNNLDVDSCILFGSYARGTATPSSDIDLVISTSITGLKFYSLVEQLREVLHKNLDVLDTKQLCKNEELLQNVLREGKRIYVQNK